MKLVQSYLGYSLSLLSDSERMEDARPDFLWLCSKEDFLDIQAEASDFFAQSGTLSFPLFGGSNALYRTDNNTTMVVKGHTINIVNAGYERTVMCKMPSVCVAGRAHALEAV